MSNLFSPSVIRNLATPGYSIRSLTRSQITESAPSTDKIWRDDPYGTGLRSSQQINVNWADFTNHTFFNSAESKVNVAFDRIINSYPFDGTKSELHEFIDSLSGFENHVLNRYPKFIGDIKFSKSSEQYISTQDKSGYLFPDISRNTLGDRSVGSTAIAGEFTVEFWLYASSSVANDNQVIFQKLDSSNNHGISLFMSKSLSGDTTVPIIFGITSGSTFVSSSFAVDKGSYQHLAFSYNKFEDNAIKVYNNSILVAASSTADISLLDFLNKDIYIGSGSSQTFNDVSFVPKETLDSNLDEFRFWKNSRSQPSISTFYQDNVYQNNDLALYYRFNEPTGSFSNNSICLDHSGNGLHGQITNFATSMRGTKLQSHLPLRYERASRSPVLFPDYTTLIDLNSELLTSASRYDSNNPNLITKLVPSHYFLEGQAYDGLENEFGDLSENYGYYSDGAVPGNGNIPVSQILSSFLFIWASFFDEIKIYIDTFSKLHDISHTSINSIPAQFLQSLGRKYGLELPNSFTNAKIDSYVYGKDLSNNSAYSSYSLREIQESLWRRMLAEIPAIQRMKGTKQSVRSTMLSLGINPDSNFRIREYGGAKTKRLKTKFQPINSWYNSLDFSKGTPFFQSRDILQGYRHEPGIPFGAAEAEQVLIDHMGAESSTIKVAKPATSPGMTAFTSASWAWEGHYILKNIENHSTQSLFRLEHSSSLSAGTKPSICVNLMALSGSDSADTETKLVLAFSGSHTSKMAITGSGINVYDGSTWWINLNHIARDLKSEFLVRAYKTNGIDVLEKHYMSGTYDNSLDSGTSEERNRLTSDSTSGNRIAIGYNSTSNYTSDLLSYSGDNETRFTGQLSGFRFWTKNLDSSEAKSHALNPFSIGSSSPLINTGFFFNEDKPIHTISSNIPSGSLPLGSWERLRLASDLRQMVSSSDSSGNINIVDISRNSSANRYIDQNSLAASGFVGYNFTADTNIFTPVQRIYSRLDPNFDITINSNKVRIKSVNDLSLAEDLNAEIEPVYELDHRAPITDDRRFSVEASLVMALNEDIVNVIADNQYINDVMGTPEQMFAINYPGLEKLSDKYFNRLTDKINTTEYFKFFKWFDNNFGQLIERLIPRTTEFLGINFVIESHMLERHRFEYKQADVHIDLNSRLAARIEPILEGRIRNEGT